jgi:hypothetical protein
MRKSEYRISKSETKKQIQNEFSSGFILSLVRAPFLSSSPSLFILPTVLFRTSKIGGGLLRQSVAGQPVEYAGLLFAVRLDVVP